MILSLPYLWIDLGDIHFVQTARVIEVSSGCQPRGDGLARKVSWSLCPSES